MTQIALHSFLIFSLTCFGTLKASESEEFVQCGSNEKSRQLAQLIVEDSEQLRDSLSCNALLSETAQKKAEEMATEGKVSHYGEGGTPDMRLKKAGYPLNVPNATTGDNHVEAVIGGYSDPAEVLDQFRNSFHHRVHLFGEHEFFLQQDEIGVGYVNKWQSPHVDYWVVYIASGKRYKIENLLSEQENKADIPLVTKPMK